MFRTQLKSPKSRQTYSESVWKSFHSNILLRDQTKHNSMMTNSSKVKSIQICSVGKFSWRQWPPVSSPACIISHIQSFISCHTVSKLTGHSYSVRNVRWCNTTCWLPQGWILYFNACMEGNLVSFSAVIEHIENTVSKPQNDLFK